MNASPALPAATAVLANGAFPVHPVPLAALHAAPRVVCCDGAAAALLRAGRRPDAVVGDLDSLDPELVRRLAGAIVRDADVETNDLTKAVRFCLRNGWRRLVILGATGLREDHTLGNLALLADYARGADEIVLLTDTGRFTPVLAPRSFPSVPGQAVSLFALDPGAALTVRGLRYPIEDRVLHRWWEATLNEATGPSFDLLFDRGTFLVYQAYAPE
jgi:thiamine pyrophosphokinase